MSAATRGSDWLDQARAGCLAAERDRGLRPRSLAELDRYLIGFVTYCRDHAVTEAAHLTPELMRAFVLWRSAGGGPPLVKAAVWSLRKLGRYLTLKQATAADPTAGLHHPREDPRARLPRYLAAPELRALLETAARRCERRELVILSLMTTTGMRPNDVAGLNRGDINLPEQRVDHRTKGGWRKGTPLSVAMTSLLASYLASRADGCDAAFVNSRLEPVTVSFVQRLVRAAGERAGLAFPLTCNHLRHTFATHAADRHGKVVTKALLGHSGLSRTEVYLHLSARRFKAVVRLHPYQHAFGIGVTDA
jgi:site-specific recombinase XerD